MADFLYDRNTLVIALVVTLLMAAAMELGLRTGLKSRHRADEDVRSQVSTMQSSLLGILALLLGFTFSMALSRFDARSDAVVDEANAIGTTWLRTGLLAEPARDEARSLLREYVGLRVQAGGLAMSRRDERATLLGEAERVQAALWRVAEQTTQQAANPATTGLFVQALNETIDSYGRRVAGLERHVPSFVILLVFGAFVVTGGVVGYTAGLGGHRPANVSYLMVGVIVVLMMMVMDLDRPQRGFIQIDQQSLVKLQEALAGDPPPVALSLPPRNSGRGHTPSPEVSR